MLNVRICMLVHLHEVVYVTAGLLLQFRKVREFKDVQRRVSVENRKQFIYVLFNLF